MALVPAGLRKLTRGHGIAGALAVGIFAVALSTGVSSQQQPSELGHPKIPNPASLSGERAEAVYQAIRGNIRRNYAASDEPLALAYPFWQRFNRVPYRSPNHGERFVNHYGNDKAAGYGKFEELKPMPPGARVTTITFTA